jgi:hypothetical protein
LVIRNRKTEAATSLLFSRAALSSAPCTTAH